MRSAGERNTSLIVLRPVEQAAVVANQLEIQPLFAAAGVPRKASL